VDLFERDGKLILPADLPGIRREDIEVSIQEGRLIIRGHCREEK
jgi:HSP20 family protein